MRHRISKAQALKGIKAKRTTLMGSVIRIDFPFDWGTVDVVKSIPGRKFISNQKYWTCPVTTESVEILAKNGFTIAPEIEALIKMNTTPIEEVEEVKMPELKRELFPFQQKGVAFIEAKGGRALIGDEMGLGKTIQALAWLALHPEKRPAVIVVPAHLKINWRKEIHATLVNQEQVTILSGTQARSLKGTSGIIIINYDILPNDWEMVKDPLTGKMVKTRKEIPYSGWVDYLIDLKPQVLIFDEAHYIKNSGADRSKAVKKLAKGIPHVIALTGTPIVNRPIEGFQIAQVINKTVFPNFWDYVHKYCDAKHNRFGWDFTGASNTEELHQKLTQSIMIRRKKADVLPDLPAKLYGYVPMEMDNREEYEEAEINFINYLKGIKGDEAAEKAGKAEHLVRIEGLKQLAIRGKMKASIQWIRDFLDTNGNKLVVFAVHKQTIDRLVKEFGKEVVKVDGSCNVQQRDAAVVAFQNDPAVKLFVGNIQAAGTGLTLTAASSVAFVELPWTPGELKQAEDRCHRIGQKNTVNVYYLLADNTIEIEIAEILDKKRKVLDAVLDGKEVEQGTLLTDLVNAYIERAGE